MTEESKTFITTIVIDPDYGCTALPKKGKTVERSVVLRRTFTPPVFTCTNNIHHADGGTPTNSLASFTCKEREKATVSNADLSAVDEHSKNAASTVSRVHYPTP